MALKLHLKRLLGNPSFSLLFSPDNGDYRVAPEMAPMELWSDKVMPGATRLV